jgi:hypothetical protein
MEPGHYREPGCQYQPQLVGQNDIVRKLFFAIFALQRDIVFALFHRKAGGNRLGVADAVTVRADQYAVNPIRQIRA